jgi:hypothetical protein
VAFFNRLYVILPSFGSPIQNDSLFLKQGTALATGTATVSLTSLAPTFSKGWVRVKIYAATGTTPAITALNVYITDGTTYVLIGMLNPTATQLALGLVPGGTQLVTNGSITSGAAILTTATANTFTPAMVGQPISVSGAGAGGIILYTSVLSYQSGTQVTLATNASTTVTTSATVTLTSYYGNAGVIATPSYGGLDFLFPFEIDLIAATQVSVLYTMTGTSGTASMDLEASITS